jgi:hypothetical protein
MPTSATHEILVELWRQAPQEAVKAVWRLRGIAVSALRLHVVEGDATAPVPVERRADLVVIVNDAPRPKSLVVV